MHNNVYRYEFFEVEGASREIESGYEMTPRELGLQEWDLIFNYTTTGIDSKVIQEIYIQVADEVQACLLYKAMSRLEEDVNYLSPLLIRSNHRLITVVKDNEGELVFQFTECYFDGELNMIDGKLRPSL